MKVYKLKMALNKSSVEMKKNIYIYIAKIER